MSVFSRSARGDPCPRTPSRVPEAVDAAVASRTALQTVERQRGLSDAGSATYEQIVAAYKHRLADSLHDEASLRDAMRAFGSYLLGSGVLPEHIVLCVHAALKDTRTARDLFDLGSLGQEMVKWTIEGYYTPGDPGDTT